MNVTLLDKVVETPEITTFKFQKPTDFNYIAGQFIQMTLPHIAPDDRGIKRWFTLSSSPTDDFISITTRFAGLKSSSFKKALFDLTLGSTVEIGQPEGDFTLPTDTSERLVFIAGGIGLTPYHSIVKYLLDSGQKRQIKLVYAVQSADQMVFGKLFRDYKVEVKTFIGERITSEQLMLEIGSTQNVMTYISGPEPMVEALTDSLTAAGLPEDSLKSDYFPGYENSYSS